MGALQKDIPFGLAGGVMKRSSPLAVRLMADLPFPTMFATLFTFAVALGAQGYRFCQLAAGREISLSLLLQACPLLALLSITTLLVWALAQSVKSSIEHLSAGANRIAQGQLDVDMDFVCREGGYATVSPAWRPRCSRRCATCATMPKRCCSRRRR